MSKGFFFLLSCLVTMVCQGQAINKEYQYSERGPSDDIQFVFSGKDSLVVGSFQMTSAKTMTRNVIFMADSFQMTSQRFKKRIMIGKPDGSNLAIMSVRKRNRYDLDVKGVRYDWVRVKASEWQYQQGGKTVMEGWVSKSEVFHHFNVTVLNPELEDNVVLEMASAHIAVSRIGKKSNAWIIVAAVAVAGLLVRPVIQSNF
jgi:hypothetical protein